MKPEVPNAPKKVSESTARAKFLLSLRSGEALICEVFFVCGRLEVEGNN